MPKPKSPTPVRAAKHKDKRANIPTEGLRDFVADDEKAPRKILYPLDPSLDPQLVGRGKDEQDRQPLEVPAVPIYIQEKIHPQVIIENLRNLAGTTCGSSSGLQHPTAREWFDYISAIPDAEYGWVEWQAYEFAGRLLVPPEPLREAFQAAIQSAQAAGYSDWLAADEAALDYIATRIAPKFGVSVEVIAKRLRVEKLWPPKDSTSAPKL